MSWKGMPSRWRAATATANRINYAPILLAASLHVDSLVAELVSGSGAGRLARMALYQADFDLQPGDRVAEGEISTPRRPA